MSRTVTKRHRGSCRWMLRRRDGSRHPCGRPAGTGRSDGLCLRHGREADAKRRAQVSRTEAFEAGAWAP